MSVLRKLFPNNYIVVILIVAAVLRMGWPAITEFKADEARLLALALDMAEFKAFALRGIGSSVGFPNFPISVWLYALPLLVWKHPYAATLFVGLLNTGAVYLCYRITRRYWGEAAALTAALMFAVSPWAVIYSRKIWAQDLLPIFVLGYIGSALLAFVDKRRGFLLLHIVLLAVIIQIHLSGAALAVLTTVLFIWHWRTVVAAWREVAIGAGIGLLLAAPLGIWLAMNASGGDGAGMVGGLLAKPAEVSLDSLRYAWLVLAGFDIHSLAGPTAFQDYLASIPNTDLVRWLWGLSALGGLGLAVWRRRTEDMILALWLVMPVVFFIRHSTPVFPHYFIITLPAGYMLAGALVDALIKRDARAKPVAMVLVPLTALEQAGFWLTLLFFIAARDTPGGFGVPLGSLLNAVDSAKTVQAEQALPEVLVVGDGDDPAVHDFPAVMEVLLRDTPHRFVNGDEAALVPQGGAAVLLQTPELRASHWYATCAQEMGCTETTVERGMQVVAVPPGVVVRVENPFPEPRVLANGVELVGWDTENGWTLIWRPGFIPAASAYHFFNHSADQQADGVGYPSRYWHDGDLILSFFDLQPTGPVRVGMYEYPSVINVPVLDAAGNPYSDAVTAEP